MQMNPFNIFFISCPLVRQIWRLIHFTFNITPPTSISICLVAGWMGWIRKQRLIFVSAFVPFFGQFGIAEMMLCLTRQEPVIFCRWYIGRPTGSTCGHFSNPWISVDAWIQDALGWWRSFGLSSTRVVGGTLVDYMMCSGLLSLFRWLIFVAAIGHIWDVNALISFSTFKLAIKKVVCIASLQRLGWSPISKNKKLLLLSFTFSARINSENKNILLLSASRNKNHQRTLLYYFY